MHPTLCDTAYTVVSLTSCPANLAKFFFERNVSEGDVSLTEVVHMNWAYAAIVSVRTIRFDELDEVVYLFDEERQLVGKLMTWPRAASACTIRQWLC